MKWNLRITAAHRGIWKASEMQRLLAGHGLVISAGKMSGLWSGTPNTIRLEELDVICAALGCEISELMTPEPGTIAPPAGNDDTARTAAEAGRPAAPRPVTGRSLPPR